MDNTSSTRPRTASKAGFPAVQCDVAVQDLLQHFDIGDEPLPAPDGRLQELLSIDLVGVSLPDQVHRDVRVQQDAHEGSSTGCPAAISSSIWSMSPVGPWYATA